MPLIDTDGNKVELDTLTSDYNSGYIVMISQEHHKIHSGQHFFCDDYDTSVDTLTPKNWLIVAPNTATRCHIIFEIKSSGAGLLEGYVGSTITDNGTLSFRRNNDGNSTNTPEMLVYKDTVASELGTIQAYEWLGSAGINANKGIGGSGVREQEIILKQDIKWLVRFTPEADDTKVSFSINWYEVPAV